MPALGVSFDRLIDLTHKFPLSVKSRKIVPHIAALHGSAHRTDAIRSAGFYLGCVFSSDSSDSIYGNGNVFAYLTEERKPASGQSPFAVGSKDMSGSDIGAAKMFCPDCLFHRMAGCAENGKILPLFFAKCA